MNMTNVNMHLAIPKYIIRDSSCKVPLFDGFYPIFQRNGEIGYEHPIVVCLYITLNIILAKFRNTSIRLRLMSWFV